MDLSGSTFANTDRSRATISIHAPLEQAVKRRTYPDATTIHLVMDNLNIDCRKSLTYLFDEQVGGDVCDRFTVL